MKKGILAVILVVAILLGAGAGYLYGSTNERTSTSTVTTEVSGLPRLPHSSIVRGPWNFTVIINTNSVAEGQPIQLLATLANIGSTNQTFRGFVEPFINPGVYATNGTQLWQWDPSQFGIVNYIFAGGQTISQKVGIPTSNLNGGYNYLIEVAPLFNTSFGNLTVTMPFSVYLPVTIG